jgi:hypothetical protein
MLQQSQRVRVYQLSVPVYSADTDASCGSHYVPAAPQQRHAALHLPQTAKSRQNPFSPSPPLRLPSQGKRNWNLFTEAMMSSLFQFPSKIDRLVFLLSLQLPSPWGHLTAVSIYSRASWRRNCGLELNISETELT